MGLFVDLKSCLANLVVLYALSQVTGLHIRCDIITVAGGSKVGK